MAEFKSSKTKDIVKRKRKQNFVPRETIQVKQANDVVMDIGKAMNAESISVIDDVSINRGISEEEKGPIQAWIDDYNKRLYRFGDPECYLYIGVKHTQKLMKSYPISLGIVSSDSHTFYAQFTDYNIKDITPELLEEIQEMGDPEESMDGYNWRVIGDWNKIANALVDFINSFHPADKAIQLVHDNDIIGLMIVKSLLESSGDPTKPVPVGSITPIYVTDTQLDVNQMIASNITLIDEEGEDTSWTNPDEFISGLIPVAISAKQIPRPEFLKAYANIEPLNSDDPISIAYRTREIHYYLSNIILDRRKEDEGTI